MEIKNITTLKLKTKEIKRTHWRLCVWTEKTWWRNQTVQRINWEKHWKKNHINQQTQIINQIHLTKKLTKNTTPLSLKEKTSMNFKL